MIFDYRRTTPYKTAMQNVLAAIRAEFFAVMKMSVSDRNDWIKAATQKEFSPHLDYWLERGPDGGLVDVDVFYTEVVAELQAAFAEDVTEVVRPFLQGQIPAPVSAPMAQMKAQEVEPPSGYPAPDPITMALDPPIPPLQTRNLYTLPKSVRAQFMPTQSVEADDNSWMDKCVYNVKGD